MNNNFGVATDAEFADLFARFYPHAKLVEHFRRPQLFVPWRPIRPARELIRLEKAATSTLTIRRQTAQWFRGGDAGVSVATRDGSEYRGRRLWIAAGSVHTPGLLEQSLGGKFSRGYISDHALCYVGQLTGHRAPAITRTREGVFFEAHYEPLQSALYTLRPARFAFRDLDYGIEQRVVFGMPTGSAVAKIVRRLSPGLLAEALYNRAGVFPKADVYSVYAQTAVRDAYVLRSGSMPLEARAELIRSATTASRERAPFAGIRLSQRHDLYIPGIHLHNSVEPDGLAAHGIDQPGSPIQIVDASTLRNIGPDHHSFKLMLLAYARARRASRLNG
jgi:hypothetical protein